MIKEKLDETKKFTDNLLAYILKANKKLNKDNKGFIIYKIDIQYSNINASTTVEVKFDCPNTIDIPIKSVICSSTKYDY